jgi:hypothetical protein
MGVNANVMANIQNDLAKADDNVNANDQHWPHWGNQVEDFAKQQAENEDVIMEEVQQQEISFDQCGSTAEYLRANGPAITLNVEDVLAGKYNNSSSSIEESSSVEGSAQDNLPHFIQRLENIAFERLTNPSIPPQLQFPIILDRVNFSGITGTLRNRNEPEANPLAIIPLQPTLHAVLISIWAEHRDSQLHTPSFNSQDTVTQSNAIMDFSLASEEQQLLGLQSEHLLEDHSQNGTGSDFCLEPHCSQTVSLPVEVSLTNPKTSLEMSSCKRLPAKSSLNWKLIQGRSKKSRGKW